jgi:preprotein translocase subunit SecE
MALVIKGNEGKDPMADDEREEDDERPETPAPTPRAATVSIGGGFFHVYKSGQGYWTRMGTAAAAVLILALIARFIYQNIRVYSSASPTLAAGIVAALLAGAALLGWYYFNKPTVVDFFIATESEMKKVNWTSRRELIGSTKIVIIFMFFIAIMLFLFDLFFGYFFQLIGVLKKVL